jgi:photosystem II stability/assembly factor-like uncharacterized protein
MGTPIEKIHRRSDPFVKVRLFERKNCPFFRIISPFSLIGFPYFLGGSNDSPLPTARDPSSQNFYLWPDSGNHLLLFSSLLTSNMHLKHLQQWRRQSLILSYLCLSAALACSQTLDMNAFEAMSPRNIGPAGMSGRVTAIEAVNSNPDIIYAGTSAGGLWKSSSGGIKWEPIFDKEQVYSIGALAIYQANPDILWAGTGEGNPRNSQTSGYGVYRSLDAGKTWTCMGLEATKNIHRVLIHPQNPDIVYVGAQGSAWGESPDRGVYKTTDGGKSWQKILYNNPRSGIADLVMDPGNPQKLIAAMWEFGRKPWTFQSGGPGSGLYVSLDGGENWQQRTEKDGLPAGELGRIGLAIAPSQPEIVYALIEAKKNGFYRSEDGGRNWKLVNDKAEIGNRPFYYADIFVDPKNENRIYSLHSLISRSEDGGKSFTVLVPFEQVHPDHHAFWIHPDNPDLLMNGNDGGMAISRDRGKNWRFVENLPLAQYYHINIDNEWPYHVYGGMQDNGSWRGPAYVWRAGGIRNSYFEELYFGDGFDVVPDPADANYGYAMSQGGFLGRYQVGTGFSQFMQPIHPEGIKLRFNWNAGIAQDPFEDGTIYYGSQFLHKSTDRGNSWAVISPDLTTNDPSKQEQAKSGGLTLDVTAAENHTSILAVAPSPLEAGVIWVGTDDGNLHITRDGGKNWQKLNKQLPGLPTNAWIPQVHPSQFQAGEAYVVVNNYRQGDWSPFLYRTRDYGKSWENLVDKQQIFGYTLSVVQDPVEPKLLFLGTEFGLYVSIDEGKTWTKWTQGFPSVSTMDLKIQPREHDLVIGTFGRAAWVLDDIRPLRELAKLGPKTLEQALKVYPAPDAVMASWGEAAGTRFLADAGFSGENRPAGAMLTFSTPLRSESDTSKLDSVQLEILNEKRDIIRTLHFASKAGLNRVYWGLDSKGVRSLSSGFGEESQAEAGGGPLLPGTYLARFQLGEQQDSTRVKVLADPRLDWSEEGMQAVFEVQQKWLGLQQQLRESLEQIHAAEASLKKLDELLPKGEVSKSVRESRTSMADSLKRLKLAIVPDPEAKGITDDSDLIGQQMGMLDYYLSSANGEINATQELALKQMEGKVTAITGKIDVFFTDVWPVFQAQAEKLKLSPFQGVNK